MHNRRPVPLLRAVVTNDLPIVLATRKYLGDLILASFQNSPEAQAYAEKLSTAAGELLENAFKYGPPGTPLLVRLSRSPEALILQIGNTLRDDARAVLLSIRKEIGAVWAEKDAREAFRKKVLASLADPKAKAMLGYAKIRMETGGRLRANLGSRGRLDVTLTFPLTLPSGPFVDRA